MKERFLFNDLICSLSADMSNSHLRLPAFVVERKPQEIWRHKIFCLLSSQFNAQRAVNIADRMLREIPFFETYIPLSKIQETCFKFLSSPQIGYRFPKVRALQISLCWFPFAQIKDEYHEYVCSFDSEEEARKQIIERFPGIGLKQASMFLRNIGASKNLSVIDVHILFYLKVCHDWNVEHLTPKRYLEAEALLKQAAEHYDLELNVFDTVVWAAARALKKASAHV
jgi:N-glycosylase/DNA lyase